MKTIFTLLIFSLSTSIFAQQDDELQRWQDTLAMGSSYLIGKQMRDFEEKDLEGKHHSSKDLLGKVTFINFWSEYCYPCVVEANALNELKNKFSTNSDFQMLSFTMDRDSIAKEFVKKHKVNYPAMALPKLSCNYLNFGKGYPTSIVIDRSGKIVHFVFGGPQDSKQADDWIKKEFYPKIEQELAKQERPTSQPNR